MTREWWPVPGTSLYFWLNDVRRDGPRPAELYISWEGVCSGETRGEVRWNAVDGTFVDWLLPVPDSLDQYIIDLIEDGSL